MVAGWTLAYIGFEASGALATTNSETLSATFNDLIGSPIQPILYAGAFTFACAAVVIGGVGAGIERASKLLMPVLFVLLLALVVRAVTLPGAAEGLEFFFVPDFSKVTGETLTAAIGQAFFSLSLGCLLYPSPSPRDKRQPRMPSSA